MEITSAWNRRARMAAILAMFAGLPAIAQNFNTIDDFNDNDDDGWIRMTAGDIAEVDARWELGDDRYTLRSETAVSPGQSGQVISTLNNTDEAQFQDGILRVKFRVNEANAGAMFGMRILTDSQGLLSGYKVMFNPSTLDANSAVLARIDMGQATSIATLERTSFNIVEDTDYFAELGVVGDDLQVRVWVNGDSRPTDPQLTAVDAAHTQGRFMLGSFVNNQLATTTASATFDDLDFAEQSTNPNPRIVGDVNGDSFIDLFWYNRESREVLTWNVDNSPGDGVFLLSTQNLDTLVDDGSTIVGRGDFNNDGYTDLVYRNPTTGANFVRTNIGRSDEGISDLPSVTSRDWHIAGVGDFNADGKSDLLWRNTKEGSTIIWTMDNTTVSSADFLPAVTERAWHPAAVGDVGNDGRADIIWRNQNSGQTVIWQMVGSLIMNQTELSPAVLDQRWQIGDLADFTGDGKADIVWRNMLSGENVIWQMDGTNVVTSFAIPQVPDLNWSFIGMRDTANTFKKDDFNNDGIPDIFWRNVGNGANLLWLMASADEVASVVALPGVGGEEWRVTAVGDINFDNKPDLIWRNSITGDNVAWLMDGATLAGSIALPGAGVEWHIIGMADANNDQVNDLYWFNSDTGDVAVWLLDGTPSDDSVVVGAISLPNESDAAWSPKGVDDVDHNGSPDIIWRNTTNGANQIWFMSGTIRTNTTQLPAVSDQAWDIAKVSDMNDDQIPDLVWHNNSTGDSTIWLLTPQGTDYYGGALFLPTVSDTSWHIQENANGALAP